MFVYTETAHSLTWLSNLVPCSIFLPSSVCLHGQHKPPCTRPFNPAVGLSAWIVDFNHASCLAVNTTLQLPLGDAVRGHYRAADGQRARPLFPTEPQDDPESSDVEEMEVEEMGEQEDKEMDVD